MIEVINYKPVNKGVLVATFNIKIQKWGNFVIREISYFKKGTQRWISLPSKQYEKDGQKKYYSFVLFEDFEKMKLFQQKILEELDKFMELNPQLIEAPNESKVYAPDEQFKMPF